MRLVGLLWVISASCCQAVIGHKQPLVEFKRKTALELDCDI